MLQGCKTKEVLHQRKPHTTKKHNLYVMREAKKKHPSVINSCNSSDGSVVAWCMQPLRLLKPSIKK